MRHRAPWLVLVMLLLPASAQAHDHTADLFYAFSFAHASKLWGLNQAYAVTIPPKKNLSVMGDLSQHFGSHEGDDVTRTTFMAGVRWMFAKGHQKHVPFVHALVGGAYTNGPALSVTDPVLAVGGGYEFLPRGAETSGGWGVRVSVDYAFDLSESEDGFPRFSAGVVYRFGGH